MPYRYCSDGPLLAPSTHPAGGRSSGRSVQVLHKPSGFGVQGSPPWPPLGMPTAGSGGLLGTDRLRATSPTIRGRPGQSGEVSYGGPHVRFQTVVPIQAPSDTRLPFSGAVSAPPSFSSCHSPTPQSPAPFDWRLTMIPSPRAAPAVASFFTPRLPMSPRQALLMGQQQGSGNFMAFSASPDLELGNGPPPGSALACRTHVKPSFAVRMDPDWAASPTVPPPAFNTSPTKQPSFRVSPAQGERAVELAGRRAHTEEKLKQWLATIPTSEPQSSEPNRQWDNAQIRKIASFAQDAKIDHLQAEDIYRRYVVNQVEMAEGDELSD
eukprot:TRINITY_DN63140_c0_g1_i1.p1 TRINITY_DN63140_c0_g1~~TRINITY_DN63140_c0_g1_i1.p1  ORF type:complete len:351 (-),score=39.52 TRINITY_DN63140_c0_g1_i1:115-1083(-)